MTSMAGTTDHSTSTEETRKSSSSPTTSEPLDLTSGHLVAPKSRENKREKAIRYLVTGRLRVLRVDSDFVAAECSGDSGEVYNLLWKHQRWSCSCPARTDCSHLNALWAVVRVNRP